MNSNDYFYQLYKNEKTLHDHGFNNTPSEDELLYFVFDLSDKLDLVMDSLNLRATKNLKGYWHLNNNEEVDSYGC